MANRTHGAERAPGPVQGPQGRGMPRTWHIAPSDLVFLWEECRACFYRKVAQGQSRPSGPFPRLFSSIDAAMKRALVGARLEELTPGAPTGTLGDPDRWLCSSPLSIPGTDSQVVLRGRADLLLAREGDEEGVVDLKTASPHDAHIPLYGRQLHAYAWARELPARGRGGPVATLGLLAFVPTDFEPTAPGANLNGGFDWIEVPRDDEAFETFLRGVVEVLDHDGPPTPRPACPWCATSVCRR